jgi:predicted O-methyltransferase YrrM
VGKLRDTRWLLATGYRYLRTRRHGAAGNDRDRDAALAALMQVYEARPDLQEVYPEAAGGDLARLINWAAGVACGRWKDSSHPMLRPYAGTYYMLPSVPPDRAVPPWSTVANTSRASANPLAATLRVMEARESADISNHLMVLSLLIREFDLKQIVELGTRDGNSTMALLESARAIGGHVTSVDIEPCLSARRRVENAGLLQNWTFIQANDMELEPPQIPARMDFLFIDTSHLYAPTLAELKKYSDYLQPGAWVALHDYVSFPGVNRAVQDFVQSAGGKFHFYAFMHQNGLALLRKV